MNLWEGAFLGVVQGLTEFLPVSSSGHLVIFQKWMGVSEVGLAFDTLLHFGTLLALIIVFRSELWDIIKRPTGWLPTLLLLGTIPTVLIGLGLKDFFEGLFQSGVTVGVELIITGGLLWAAESMKGGKRQLKETRVSDALIIGVLQGLAIFPAISRSGATIAGGLFRGLDREWAARFSFLLSIPAILGATILQLMDLSTSPQELLWLPYIVGTVAAAVSGYLAIKFMLRLITRGSLKVFSYYVWALAGIIIYFQLTGRF